jgi:hypothetical protein
MRKLLIAILALSIIGCAPAHAAAIKTGAKCTKLKATTTVNGLRYTCVNSGTKLVWSKGVPVKNASSLKKGVCPSMAAADKDPGISQVRADALVTMTEADAESCAMNLDWLYRVGQRDDAMFAGTFDYRTDRVTVTVMKGFVTQVNVG